MPWFEELSMSDLVRRGVVGERVVERFWGDQDPPHRYRNGHHLIESVKVSRHEVYTLRTHYYTENGTKKPLDLHYWDTAVVSAMVDDRHDDRLIVPGGYLVAHPGTMWKVWDACVDGGGVARSVSLKAGREYIGRG